jgi:tetratricopeptide (TPR) repeat protein
MATRAKSLLAAWARKPGAALATTLRSLYAKEGRKLPLKLRAELCMALGEAAELDGRVDKARWLYASAVDATDPIVDERLYARAVLRSLLNSSRLGDDRALLGVAALTEKSPAESQTPRLAYLGSFARGLERFLREDYDAARRSFEAAMGLSWECAEPEAEALAHHLLAQTWGRLGRLARAREHAEAALVAARKAESWILDRRLALEAVKYKLRAGMAPQAIKEARALAQEIRKLGFPRFESLAWTKIAQGILVDRVSAQVLLTKSEGLLPEGHPDRRSVLTLLALVEGKAANGRVDKVIAKELQSLVALARRRS